MAGPDSAEGAALASGIARPTQRRVAALTQRCPGITTPMLGGVESQAALTPRELQVARLSVSVRTVETQLQRGYEKLGVRRRADLEHALRS